MEQLPQEGHLRPYLTLPYLRLRLIYHGVLAEHGVSSFEKTAQTVLLLHTSRNPTTSENAASLSTPAVSGSISRHKVILSFTICVSQSHQPSQDTARAVTSPRRNILLQYQTYTISTIPLSRPSSFTICRVDEERAARHLSQCRHHYDCSNQKTRYFDAHKHLHSQCERT